ncbi:MAG: dihydrodipicolinate synthase family protein [Proteobacteria bacterium]|nr:dihydrodipicolinate synthase family protein [Pseudomonadota bacterium]
MSTARISETERGVYVIAVTPFAEDGSVDFGGTRQMVDFFCGLGVQGMTILGVAGEASKMTEEESEAFAACVIRHMSGRLPVVVGVSNQSLASLTRLSHKAMELGAAGVMMQPQGALRTDDDVYNYMEMVLAALGPGVPVVYQDYPQVSGVTMSLSTWERVIRAFPQVVMMKHEQVPGLTKLSRIRALEKEKGLRRISILVGNNAIYFPQELRRGADGAMTGFAFPDMLVKVLERWTAGDRQAAEDLFDAYLPVLRYELQPGFGLSVRKEILVRRGAIPTPKVRYPGPRLSPVDHAELEALLDRLNDKVAALESRAAA